MNLGYVNLECADPQDGADLRSSATILLEGGPGSLDELCELFRSMAAGRIKKIAIHRLPFVHVHHGVELRAVCGNDGQGVRRDGPGSSFQWERSRAGWAEAADRLEALSSGPPAGHHFFAAEQGEVEIAISKGEYGEQWWSEQRAV